MRLVIRLLLFLFQTVFYLFSLRICFSILLEKTPVSLINFTQENFYCESMCRRRRHRLVITTIETRISFLLIYWLCSPLSHNLGAYLYNIYVVIWAKNKTQQPQPWQKLFSHFFLGCWFCAGKSSPHCQFSYHFSW